MNGPVRLRAHIQVPFLQASICLHGRKDRCFFPVLVDREAGRAVVAGFIWHWRRFRCCPRHSRCRPAPGTSVQTNCQMWTDGTRSGQHAESFPSSRRLPNGALRRGPPHRLTGRASGTNRFLSHRAATDCREGSRFHAVIRRPDLPTTAQERHEGHRQKKRSLFRGQPLPPPISECSDGFPHIPRRAIPVGGAHG